MPPPEVRDLAVGDIPRILELEADLFGPEAWTAGMYREELSSPFRAYRGIDDAGALVAYGGILVAEEAQVLTIGVARSHQRRGLGGVLLRDLLSLAGRHAREVFLEVRASDDVARRLYERHGFTVIGRRRDYYPRIGEDALVMRAELPRDTA
ncbi:MAG: ribosomal protein S18-alanine N-acetyltransferase [Actinomycetota bacterium]